MGIGAKEQLADSAAAVEREALTGGGRGCGGATQLVMSSYAADSVTRPLPLALLRLNTQLTSSGTTPHPPPPTFA